MWVANIKKGLENLNPESGTFVCANPFIDGKPTSEHPNLQFHAVVSQTVVNLLLFP